MQEEERIGYVKNMLKVFGEFMRDSVPKTIEVLTFLLLIIYVRNAWMDC